MKKLFLSLSTAALLAGSASAQFTAGNLAIIEATASASNTTAAVKELNKTGTSQSAITTYNINGTTGTDALRFSGSATSTLYLANSNDRTLLCFTGVTSTNTTSNANSILTRGVGVLNAAGTYSLAATYTGASGNQTRCATTVNDTNYYIADQGGLYTNNATTASPAGNFRAVKAFGGTVYISTASSTTTAIQIGTITAPSGDTVTSLPGLTNNANLQDFYLISSGSNGTAFDVLYTISASSNTAGTIAKYSKVSGTWTANGTYTTTFGGFGLAAEASGTGANLYLSSGQGALVANSLIKLVDQAGYNSTINITTANNVTLYTAPAGAIIKGVAFAPIVAPALTVTPSAIANTFTTSVNTTSASDSFTVSGANLSGNVTVTAPASFQVATSLTGTYSTAITLTATGGTLAATKVYVRFAPTVTGTVTGNVVVIATGANPKNVSVTGVTPGPVVLASVTSITNPFVTLVNTTSAIDSFTVSGANLNGNVTVTAPASFEIAATPTGTFGATLTLTPALSALAATKVFVRFHPTTPGTVTGNITVAATGATTQNVSVTGNTPTPVITSSVTAIANTFTAAVNSVSASDTFSVAGTALNDSLTVTAPANFEIATTQAGPYTMTLKLPATAGTVASTKIYVRFHPTAAGAYTDTVKVTATGAVTQRVLVSGLTVSSTNPAAYALSSGNYQMNSWDSAAAAGTYPQSMIFHTTNNATPALTTAPLVANWTCPYNLGSRPRVKGLNADGFSMINTGSPQYDNCSGGATTMNTFLGAALLAVNTTGVTNLNLNYKAGLVKQSDGATPRVYNLRLQYRFDSVSAFVDMAPLAEYTSAGKTDGDVQSFNIALPALFEQKAYVEFRWLYYADATVTGGGGTRPEIRLDDIFVGNTASGIGGLSVNNRLVRVYPNPVMAGSVLHFSQPVSGKLIDAFGRTAGSFSNATTLETTQLAAGIYHILTADGSRCRIAIQ